MRKEPYLAPGFDYCFRLNEAGELDCTINTLRGECRAVIINGKRYEPETPVGQEPEAVQWQVTASRDLGFVERCDGGHGRTSIKRSHRAEGRNFVD